MNKSPIKRDNALNDVNNHCDENGKNSRLYAVWTVWLMPFLFYVACFTVASLLADALISMCSCNGI